MTDLEKQRKQLECLEQFVKLSTPNDALWALDIQKIIGGLQFHIWIRERKE